jgi:hypothetical protein
MAADQNAVGDKLWERFKAGKKDIEWYYRCVAAALPDLAEYKMYHEFPFGRVFWVIQSQNSTCP